VGPLFLLYTMPYQEFGRTRPHRPLLLADALAVALVAAAFIPIAVLAANRSSKHFVLVSVLFLAAVFLLPPAGESPAELVLFLSLLALLWRAMRYETVGIVNRTALALAAFALVVAAPAVLAGRLSVPLWMFLLSVAAGAWCFLKLTSLQLDTLLERNG
ncbi:MAG: hypothetical protein V2A58_09705, partial [Planctomycetota bacterium]